MSIHEGADVDDHLLADVGAAFQRRRAHLRHNADAPRPRPHRRFWPGSEAPDTPAIVWYLRISGHQLDTVRIGPAAPIVNEWDQDQIHRVPHQ